MELGCLAASKLSVAFVAWCVALSLSVIMGDVSVLCLSVVMPDSSAEFTGMRMFLS